MKFNTILSLIFIFLLSSSYVISSTNAIHSHKRHQRRSLSHSSHKIQNRNHHHSHHRTADCPLPAIEFVPFFYALVKKVTQSFLKDAVSTVMEATGMSDLAKVCTQKIKDAFKQNVQDVWTESQREAMDANNNNKIFVQEVSAMGLSKDDRDQLQEVRTNPRKVCKTTLEIFNNKHEKMLDYKESALMIVKLANEAISENKKIEDLEVGFFDWFNRSERNILYDLTKDFMSQGKTLAGALKEVITIMSESNAESERMIKKILSTKTPECDKLPDVDFDKCAKAGLTSKLKAFYKLMKDSSAVVYNADMKVETVKEVAWTAGTCLVQLFLKDQLKNIVSFGLEHIIGLFLNIFGLFIFKMIKLVYYAIKIIYYIYKAEHEEKDIDKKSVHWGNAVGTIIKFAIVIAHPGEKRFRRRFRK
jgi:hypothetical protein